MSANIDYPISTLEELPQSGLILLSDVLSTGQERRLIPFTANTWRRMISKGQAPAIVKLAGRNAVHAQHVRAFMTGHDWRGVSL